MKRIGSSILRILGITITLNIQPGGLSAGLGAVGLPVNPAAPTKKQKATLMQRGQWVANIYSRGPGLRRRALLFDISYVQNGAMSTKFGRVFPGRELIKGGEEGQGRPHHLDIGPLSGGDCSRHRHPGRHGK